MLFSRIGRHPAVFFRQCVDGLFPMKQKIFFPVHLFPEFFQQAQLFLNIPDFPVRQHGAVGEKFLIMDPSLIPGQEAGKFLQGNIQENAGADGMHHGNLGKSVVTVSGIRVRIGREQNAQLFIIPEGFDMYAGLFGQIADG